MTLDAKKCLTNAKCHMTEMDMVRGRDVMEMDERIHSITGDVTPSGARSFPEQQPAKDPEAALE